MKKILLITSCALLSLAAVNAVASNTSNAQDISFPDIEKSYLKDFPRYNGTDLVLVNTGIDDDTVRQLIGNPHFNEFMSKKWNYVFNIRNPYTTDYIQCQLQLHFDKDKIVESYYWSSPACALAVKPEQKPLPKVESRMFTLSSDLLFDFDSANLKSSSSVSIDKLTQMLNTEYKEIKSIKVVGHADRLGNRAYNHNLALQRAQTIKNQLQGRGFNASLISVSSMGDKAPLTDGCPNVNLTETKLCLAPDRRVTIDVTAVLN